MSSKRKKPTKAEAKAKKTKRQTGAPVPKKVDFSALVEEANGRKIVLHIGCGEPNPEKLHKRFRGDDWFELRLDINPDVKPHIISDMTDMNMLPDNSVDALWSSHNIEHLYPHIVPMAFKEFFRVIKPEGCLLVTMPDIQTVAAHVAHGNLEDPIYESPAGPIAALDIMYGLRRSVAKGNYFMSHKTAFTAKTLAKYLREAGFSNVVVSRDWIDLWAMGHKYPPGHKLRNEKVELHENTEKRMKPPPLPPLSQQPHPGVLVKGRISDELDLPPKVWKPLNLKNA